MLLRAASALVALLVLTDSWVAATGCGPACAAVGNCGEFVASTAARRCECPFGRSGPACQDMLLPACRLENMPEAAVSCEQAGATPKSCECHRQCVRLFCQGDDDPEGDRCVRPYPIDLPCFERVGLPHSQQLSAIPAAKEAGVEFYDTYRLGKERQKLAASSLLSTNSTEVVPHSACRKSQGCNTRGTCIVVRKGSQTGRRCLCNRGYVGKSCELVLGHRDGSQWSCWHQCSGRGTCKGGFCHCKPGFFGLDCSRDASHALQPPPPPLAVSPARLLPSRPLAFNSALASLTHGSGGAAPQLSAESPGVKIYVYEIPTHLSFQPATSAGEIYAADQMFLSLLLKDRQVRTQNPWEAHLFFIPTYAATYGGKVAWRLGAAQYLLSLISYVRQAWPFWNRTNGADHSYFVTNDVGTAPWSHKDPLLNSPIKIVHFGYDYGSRTAIARLRRSWRGFNASRDVVAAPHDAPHLPAQWAKGCGSGPESPCASVYDRHPDLTAFVRQKSLLLFFVGSFFWDGSRDRAYGFGVRQALFELFAERSNSTGASASASASGGQEVEVVVAERLPEGSRYLDLIQRARFCLAPPGWGWGVRLATYALHGCLPVIVQDDIFQPYEDILPYERFSIRMSRRDLPKLVSVLSAVPETKLVSMYEALREHHRAFVWPSTLAGQAYDYTIASLAKRALAGQDAP